ncbi:MAG: putative glycolipid-binding domain-containing protein, partial [Dongiaceae bacterium]
MTRLRDGIETAYFWAAAEGPGLEHLRVRPGPPESIAHGLVLGVRDGQPYRLLYKIKWGPDWRVRKATFEVQDARGPRERMLKTDGRGKWRDDNDELPELAGCTDLDIAATPFTNTLALKRLDLKPGQATEIRTAYVSLPG